MSDLVTFPAKLVGVETANIDKMDFFVFCFVRPVYFDQARATFNIEQLSETPNFKKWVKSDDIDQYSILSSLEVNKVHTLRWLVTAKYDKESKKNKLAYTVLPLK